MAVDVEIYEECTINDITYPIGTKLRVSESIFEELHSEGKASVDMGEVVPPQAEPEPDVDHEEAEEA